MKKEIIWIDWVKFICMLLVYWDHVMLIGNIEAPFLIQFRAFFVNAFFFISGYLIFRKQLSPNYIQLPTKPFLQKALSRTGMVMNILFKIAIPTLIFSIPLFFPTAIIRGQQITLDFFIFDRLIKGSYWFTCALTVAEIIIFALLLFRIRNIIFYLASTMVLAIFALYLQNIEFQILENPYAPWFYKSGLISSFFLALGGLYQKYELFFDKYGAFYIVLFIIVSLNYNQDTMPMSTLQGMSFTGFIISIISILGVIYICKRFSSARFVKYVSKHSIGFYFLSALSPFLSTKLCNIYISGSALSFILQFLLSFSISWIIIFLLNKYLPFIFDLRVLFKKQTQS